MPQLLHHGLVSHLWLKQVQCLGMLDLPDQALMSCPPCLALSQEACCIPSGCPHRDCTAHQNNVWCCLHQHEAPQHSVYAFACLQLTVGMAMYAMPWGAAPCRSIQALVAARLVSPHACKHPGLTFQATVTRAKLQNGLRECKRNSVHLSYAYP